MIKQSVVLIGSGNVAYHLAKIFIARKVPIKQVYNRSRKGLNTISNKFNIPTTSSLKKLVSDADIYIVATSDDSIEEVSQKIAPHIHDQAVVAHTSGNTSIQKLGGSFENFGAFYPLQSFRKKRNINFDLIPIFISSSNQKSQKQLCRLANIISERVIKISDEDRALLHIPAVMVNNFVNHIYSMAYDYCQNNDLDFTLLNALMEETYLRVKSGSHPEVHQTGPAVRHDVGTIKMHQNRLKEDRKLKKLYTFMTDQIQNYYNENN